MSTESNKIVILGGGLAGLSAGYALTRGSREVTLLESDTTVGGLSKTVVRGEFRFDLGGHRFHTRKERIGELVKTLMGEEMIPVHRRSKIYLQGKYFDYPLQAKNAFFGLGLRTSMMAILDYVTEKLRNIRRETREVSLEDWVVHRFGRTIFLLYFKEYSEKVWGIDCSRISAEWIAGRISGLSLGVAVRNAFFAASGGALPTLAESFTYPALGIGRISQRLKEAIEEKNTILMGRTVKTLHHRGFRVQSAVVHDGSGFSTIDGGEFISTIPVTTLIRILDPRAPDKVLAAVSRLKYRDLVVVAVMVNRERVTDQTWIYLPERKIPFGRIHEPKNWSPLMAPPGRSAVVAEYFCSEGDEIWTTPDEELSDLTTAHLEGLGFFTRGEVIGGCVVRVPKAYPLFEIGYRKDYETIANYLNNFRNLHSIGRGGVFKYYNMDHTMESGLTIADRIMRQGFRFSFCGSRARAAGSQPPA